MPPDYFDSLAAIPDDFHVVRLNSQAPGFGDDVEFMNNLAEVGGRAFEIVREIERVRAANRAVRERLVNASR
jgi:hypothetical protein